MADNTKTAGSSLNNFGVFVGNHQVDQALQHPMQKFRFTVSLPGFGAQQMMELILDLILIQLHYQNGKLIL